MAIAFNAAADGGNNGGTTNSLTFSYTCSSGSNRLLLVAFLGDVISGNDDITGVTYNSVSMTQIAKITAGGANNRILYFYYQLNPSTGANNVVINCTNNHYLLAGAADYTGVSALDNSGTNPGSGSIATLTTSVTPVAANCWVMLADNSVDVGAGSRAPVAGSGSTRRTFDAAFIDWAIFDSNAAVTGGSAYSMTTKTPPGDGTNPCNTINHIIASFSPAISTPVGFYNDWLPPPEFLKSSEVIGY